jgi:hypothetical protein
MDKANLQATASTAPEDAERSSSGKSGVDASLSSSKISLFTMALASAFSTADPRRVGRELRTETMMVTNATDQHATLRKLRERLSDVLNKAVTEDFREGVPSAFATDLRELVLDFGAAALPELQRVLATQRIPNGVGFEALNVLASFNYRSILLDRRHLIDWALSSETPEVRYGAAFAVATLRDRAAVQPLIAAIRREQIPDLKRAFEKVLRTLGGESSVGTAF